MRTPLRPQPERLGVCPADGEPLQVIRLQLPGWRTLVEGHCDRCGHEYVQDLPAGHGLVYPTTLDLTAGTTIDPAGASWFSSRLADAYVHPDDDPVAFEVEGRAEGPAVLVNCLDPVYGHALLRLLSLDAELARAPGAVIALVPRALTPLVPDGVAERWIVDEPLARLRGWLLDLDRRLGRELDRLGDASLAAAPPHPHPSTYEIQHFVGAIEPERRGQPSVLLSLRADRTWGPTGESEAERLAALAAGLLRAYPGAALTAVGLGAAGGLPGTILDLRNARPTEADELRWLACMRGADLAIGVHGSNLLLPSGLARATVELVGAERFSNVGQATLLTEDDPVLALARHRTLYGDAQLSDLSGARVVEVAVAVLDGIDRVELLMTGPAAGQGEGRVPAVGAELIRGTHDSAQEEPPLPLSTRGAAAAGALARRAAGTLRPNRAPSHKGDLPAVLTDRRGLRFELNSAETADAFVQHGGHFEGDAIDLVMGALRPGDVAIDVGANIGAFTAAMAKAVGEQGRVLAFEPFAPARAGLERTIALNSLTNVEVIPEAVSDEDGDVELVDYGPGFESWSTLAPREIDLAGGRVTEVGRTTVPATTLASAVASRGLHRVAVLKVDVEGAESRVVAGARELLEPGRVDILVMEVSDETLEADGASARQLLRTLEQMGLRVYELAEEGLVPFRAFGRVDRLVQAVAVTAAGLDRLGRSTRAQG